MNGQKTSTKTLRAAALGVTAVALCCGAPVLLVAGGTVVATLGGVILGIGVVVAMLAAVAVLLVYRAHRNGGQTCAVDSPSPDSVPRKV